MSSGGLRGLLPDSRVNVGALIIGIDFGVYYTIIIIRNPRKPILIIKVPTLVFWTRFATEERTNWCIDRREH